MNIDFFNIAGRILRISHSIVLQTPRSLQPKCGVKRLRLTTKTGRLGASPPTDIVGRILRIRQYNLSKSWDPF